MAVTHYKQLGVYGFTVEVRKQLFLLSKAWPKEERYALTDQVRRSSRSISANIAEAWAKQRYERHFISKLTDALAEAEETIVWLDVALECGYLDEERHKELTRHCRQICGGLVTMMRDPTAWCGPAGLVKDAPSAYMPDE